MRTLKDKSHKLPKQARTWAEEVKEMVQSGEAYSLRTLKLFTSSCLQTALKKDQSDLAMFADILHRMYVS